MLFAPFSFTILSMISVAMATYNGERYIREQLESIWNQSIKPDEIVISDDHSKDNTLAVIDHFVKITGAPVVLIRNQENRGFIKNFHIALEAAKGDIVFLSDQDDLWLPGRIEKCMELFQHRSEILALSCGIIITDSINSSVPVDSKSKKTHLKRVSRHSFLRHPKYPGMAMAVRKSVIKDKIFTDNTEAAHDWLLNYSALQKDGMYVLRTPLVLYRQHDQNTIGSLQSGNRDQAAQKRADMLSGIATNLQSVHADSLYEKNLTACFIKRSQLIKEKRTLNLLIHDLFHLRFVSLKSIAGDLYSVHE